MPHHLLEWKPLFIAALQKMPVVAAACEAAMIERSTAYRARVTDPDFAQAWDDAMEAGIDRAEQEAFRRGMIGFEEPVIDRGRLAYQIERYEDDAGVERYRPLLDAQGQPVPLTTRRHSDALLALVLKGRRKTVYADRKELTGADGAALTGGQVIIATGVPSDDYSDLA